MLKTLAAKHRSRVTPMARKYQAKIDTPHVRGALAAAGDLSYRSASEGSLSGW
jgi:hypothetical protein